LPSASNRLNTGVAAPVNDDDHFMAAITLAAVALPLVDHRTTVVNRSTAANLPKVVNPYIKNGPVHPSRPVDIEKQAVMPTTKREDKTPTTGLRASPALLSLDDISSCKVDLLNVIIDDVFNIKVPRHFQIEAINHLTSNDDTYLVIVRATAES